MITRIKLKVKHSVLFTETLNQNTNSFEGGIFVQYVKSIKYLFIIYPKILLALAVLEGRKSVTSFKRERLFFFFLTIMNNNKNNLLSLSINSKTKIC